MSRSRCSVARIGEAANAVQTSLQKIAEAGYGVILYLRQRENNLDLVNQLKTYALMQEKGVDFQTAKLETGYGKVHDHGIGAQILKDLGVKKIRLLRIIRRRSTRLRHLTLR